jgi:hypothetical protein
MSDLVAEDFNGDTYLVGSSGEREEYLNSRVVAVPQSMPFNRGTPYDRSNPTHNEYLDLFYRINYHFMVHATVQRPAQPAAGVAIRVPAANLAINLRKIAYVRTLSARMSHYDYGSTAMAHHARYAEYRNFTWAGLQTFMREYLEDNTLGISNLDEARAIIPQVADHAADAQWRSAYRQKHLNVVCLVAYMFRARGHHWLTEMDDRYKAVWRKCLYDEENPGVEWEYLAHNALHAIFPDDLDAIWQEAADNDCCAGALIKRYESMPAGVAVIAAVNAGVSDLKLLLPRAFDYVPEAMQHLVDLNRTVGQNRHAGSVNRRLYNAPEVRVDEVKLAPLASIIVAGLKQLVTDSPLLKSKALARVANNAPMTGAMIGKMVNTALKSDAAAEIFLPQLPAP